MYIIIKEEDFEELIILNFSLEKDRNKKVHFIGIGGISMSGLADILLEHGFKVSGSDMKGSPITDKLAEKGAKIFVGQNEKNIGEADADIIVYTAAISQDNPELIAAKASKAIILDRAEFLGALMKDHKYNVAIAGTHGKTTATSMISHIALSAEVDPTILVGGELDEIGGNVRCGKSEYFIAEACEYKASFLKFYPYIGIILNVDADHLDFYKDISHIEDTFLQFAKLIPKDGYLIVNAEDERVMNIASKVECNVFTFGFNKGTLQARNISYDKNGCASFDIYKNDTFLYRASLNVPGKHNILNALASTCTALSLNLPDESVIKGLANFKGTHRRFELKGKKNGVTVIDDYAHHPTEIKATLGAAKNYPHRKVVCVFQPHTYSRTITLFDEFVKAFSDADELILADIYAAREKDKHEVSSDMLGDKIRENGQDCKNLHSFEDIVAYLNDSLKDGDLLLTVGAGDVVQVGEMYLEA